MRLFNVDLEYAASRRVKGRKRYRTEYGVIRMVVMAIDEADSRSRAYGWFRHQLTQPALARVLFGTGIRDCDPATVQLAGEILASESDLPHIAVVAHH